MLHPVENRRHLRRLRRRLWDADPHCHWCGRELAMSKATLDHVVPQCRGGTHDAGNVVLSCAWCNNAKGDRQPDEWLRFLESTVHRLRTLVAH
jgi:5-methylcytosine-specific restriction endonuclease McrA